MFGVAVWSVPKVCKSLKVRSTDGAGFFLFSLATIRDLHPRLLLMLLCTEMGDTAREQ